MITILSITRTACIIAVFNGFFLTSHAVSTPVAGTPSFAGSSTIQKEGYIASSQFTAFSNTSIGSAETLSGGYRVALCARDLRFAMVFLLFRPLPANPLRS